MKKYFSITIIFITVLLLGTLYNFARQSSPFAKTQASLRASEPCPACKDVLPQAEEFSAKAGSPPVYRAYKTNSQTKQKELCGFVFLTTDIAPEISGYSGPIKILVGIDTQGTIRGIQVLEHSETSSYIENLGIFLKQFLSRSNRDSFVLGKDIDAISGATVTSTAITRAVEKSLAAVTQGVLKSGPVAGPARNIHLPVPQIIMPLLIFGLAITGIFRRRRMIRWLSLITALLYLGLLRKTFLSAVQLANIGLLRFPDFNNSPLWYFLVPPAIFSCFFIGRIYCGSICPFASTQEMLYNSFQKIWPKKLAVSSVIDGYCRYAKHVILIIILVASFLVGNADPSGIEVFITFFTTHGSWLAWALLIVILFLSLFNFRFWCKYLCPTGVWTGLCSQASILKIRPDANCTACQHCVGICPVDAIKINAEKALSIDPVECIMCGKCLTACPFGALKLRK